MLNITQRITQPNPDAKGLALLIHPKIKDSVTGFKTYPDRAVKMKVNIQGTDSVTGINVYAPRFNAEDEKVEQFYGDNKRAMTGSESKYKIFTEDFNAKVGTKTKEEYFKNMGAFGMGKDMRVHCLIEFTVEHRLVMANTLFQKQKDRYRSWKSPNRQTKN